MIQSREKTARYAWLDLLRAMAVLIVMWDHFVGEYLAKTGQTWLPDRIVNVAIFQPFGITQFGGFFGVCLFFLISGYIIIRVSTNETASKFAIRRVFRIFPPLVAAVAFVIVGGKMGFSLYAVAAGATWKQALTNVTLVNYFMTPQVIFVGVAWTLVIEVIFYSESLLLTCQSWRLEVPSFSSRSESSLLGSFSDFSWSVAESFSTELITFIRSS